MKKLISILFLVANLSSCALLDTSQSILGSTFTIKPRITIAERNAVLEALTNYEWTSINKSAITNKYVFRVDDNGLVVAYTRIDTGEKSPEYYMHEAPRGYKLDFPNLDAYLKFWLTETRSLVKSVKIGSASEDVYPMTPHVRSEAYDDDIF